jgi:hypothetical protein
VKLSTLPALPLVIASVATAAARPAHVLGKFGISLTLPKGWHGLAAPGQLQAADFRLGARALQSPELARVPRGRVHLIVWDYGPAVPYLAANFRTARLPLAIARRDLSGRPLEGFPDGHTYAVRTATVGEELVEVVADLGPKPFSSAVLERANRVLATLRVQPPRVVTAQGRRLASGGIALRLLRGWSGRIEVPADRHFVQLVVRARHGDLRLVLLELADASAGHAELPVAVTGKNVLARQGRHIARRVFSSAGRGFDLSVVFSSRGELGLANRLLRTLTAAPRPWTFRSCELSVRLPGTWRAAINPRSGCYPLITLRGPGVRVVLSELRPRERSVGRVVLRARRRFRVQIIPPTAAREANAVLATLSAKPRT